MLIFPSFEISTLPFSRDSRKSECFYRSGVVDSMAGAQILLLIS